jgi:hypothetical protein
MFSQNGLSNFNQTWQDCSLGKGLQQMFKKLKSFFKDLQGLELRYFAQGIVLWTSTSIVQIIALGSKFAPFKG